MCSDIDREGLPVIHDDDTDTILNYSSIILWKS